MDIRLCRIGPPEGDLPLAEAITYRCAVFGYPAAAELIKVVDPARVNLRPQENMVRNIEAHRRREVRLKMIGALEVAVGRAASRKNVAIRLRVIELEIDRAKSGLEFWYNAFGADEGMPNPVKVEKSRSISQTCIRALFESEVGLATDPKMRR